LCCALIYIYSDTYVKYVHKLCNQHLQSSNFIEAGLTLLLHADLLKWVDEMVEELPEGYFAFIMSEMEIVLS
jgi:dedicator of cytokinesis protein 3